MELNSLLRDNFSMAKKKPVSTDPTSFFEENPAFFFRQWRDYRGMNQEPLAGISGLTPASISQIENGKQGFTDKTLVALARALKCHPGELLMRDPTATGDFWTVWDSAPRLQSLFRRLADIPESAQLQVIGYAEGVIERYESIRETATTPNS